ncbi:LutC/YkgG family protein [Chryseolinea lacunae]|uniref:LUD domain-containing protein n=1 Tax=Chryseolinea lacunae TaxID=2801331 RepID=A0ABS1KJP9_9BACT|nr:LUD domain-containing protein [Chryseolinea lacunae]MBL0739691.1 LUD domain-containing protein [Chryseolinea lacunae]
MSSREKILATIKQNQPPAAPLPSLALSDLAPVAPGFDAVQKFTTVLQGIGGSIVEVKNWDQIHAHLSAQFPSPARIINLIPEIHLGDSLNALSAKPHTLEDVNLAVIKGQFGVAENSAIWITDTDMGDRALPFICEHLALVIRASSIVNTMHHAYERIHTGYAFGTFLAGPSKTADIEQSLVLGAHGAKTLTVFLLP